MVAAPSTVDSLAVTLGISTVDVVALVQAQAITVDELAECVILGSRRAAEGTN